MIEMIKDKREAVAEHCRRLNVRRFDVFGSAARGDFNPETSDLIFTSSLASMNALTPCFSK